MAYRKKFTLQHALSRVFLRIKTLLLIPLQQSIYSIQHSYNPPNKKKKNIIFAMMCVLFCYLTLLFIDLQNTAMPDERAVMTYVSSYYHCFSGAQKVGSKKSKFTTTTKQKQVVDVLFIFKLNYLNWRKYIFWWTKL